MVHNGCGEVGGKAGSALLHKVEDRLEMERDEAGEASNPGIEVDILEGVEVDILEDILGRGWAGRHRDPEGN
ncbi:hypothetical protein GN156_20220 [bacterium LRH843]|nr:hypothetical protein [bacterium LRH843]